MKVRLEYNNENREFYIHNRPDKTCGMGWSEIAILEPHVAKGFCDYMDRRFTSLPNIKRVRKMFAVYIIMESVKP